MAEFGAFALYDGRMDSVPRIKICGLTNLDDARLAVEGGAWALGLIFHRPSPRRCSRAAGTEISSQLRREAEVCGVFVDATLERVTQTADEVGLSLLQFHGSEGPAYCAEAARRTGARVIKAVSVRSRADLQVLETFHTDFHMLDSHAPDRRGGTGEAWDWSVASGRRSSAPLILSGGLTAENVAAGIATTTPWGVDVASGTEAEPGRKDPARLDAFFDAVRRTAPPAEVAS